MRRESSRERLASGSRRSGQGLGPVWIDCRDFVVVTPSRQSDASAIAPTGRRRIAYLLLAPLISRPFVQQHPLLLGLGLSPMSIPLEYLRGSLDSRIAFDLWSVVKHLEKHWSESLDPSFFRCPPLGQDTVDVLIVSHFDVTNGECGPFRRRPFSEPKFPEPCTMDP